MRRVRRGAVPGIAALVTALFLSAASCKIPGTGVVDAGEPATGVAGSAEVYFVALGRLTAVERLTELPADPDEALRLLTGGPSPDEAGKGMTTEVPVGVFEEGLAAPPVPAEPSTAAGRPPRGSAPPGAPGDAVPAPSESTGKERRWATSSGNRVTVLLVVPPGKLSPLGREQIVCTAASAHLARGRGAGPVEVVLEGPEGSSAPQRCERPREAEGAIG